MNKVIILGGGLTGLSAAYHHPQALVFEKENVLGGHGKSHSVDSFIFDEGIHVVHTTDPQVLALYEKVGVKFLVKKREAWIQSHGALTRYPFQANTYGLPVHIVKDCLVGLIKNDFDDRTKIKNYEDWIYCIFGKGIAEHFMIPYARKFWGVHPRELMTDWVDVRHPRPTLEEVIEGALHEQKKGFGVNVEFRYPALGFGEIGEAFAKQIGNRLRLGMEVTRIDVFNKQIEFNGSEVISYDQILSTIPLPALIHCLPQAPDEVKEAAGKLRANSFLVVNIGLNRPEITDKHWIYYLEKEFPFIRLSFTANYSSSVVPEGKSAISAEIAYNRQSDPLPASPEEMVKRTVESLKKLGFIRTEDKILLTHTIDIKYAYIIHDKDRVPAARIIQEYLRKFDIYPCGRYGDWGYLWSHDAVLSGRDAAIALKEGKIPHPSGGVCTKDGCECAGEFEK